VSCLGEFTLARLMTYPNDGHKEAPHDSLCSEIGEG
jgi:hypothetical protein